MKAEPIVAVLLTGFLGSGKTTLLRRLLDGGAWPDTAIVVNELGEVGLDHRLLWQSAGQVVLLDDGCLCCGGAENLVETLESLFWDRLHRKLPYFRRVVIETTGLADPRPVLAILRTHPLISERYRLGLVLCTVDAQQGAAPLERHPESRAQVDSANLIAITKTDLSDAARMQVLEQQLGWMNPAAAIAHSGSGSGAGDMTLDLVDALVASHVADGSSADASSRPFAPRGPITKPTVFHGRVTTCTVRLDRFRSREALRTALEAVAGQFGSRILRLKGIAYVAGESSPIVVQMVSGRLSPFETPAMPPLPTDAPERGHVVAIMEDDVESALRCLFSEFQAAGSEAS